MFRRNCCPSCLRRIIVGSIIHITYGYILAASGIWKSLLRQLWKKETGRYTALIEQHMTRHLEIIRPCRIQGSDTMTNQSVLMTAPCRNPNR